MKFSFAIFVPLFSIFTLSGLVTNAQILQNDTTICLGSAVLLSVDTTQITGTPCTAGFLLPVLQNSLVAYYPFCGNANDASGNGNNGTVFGATLTTDRYGVPNRAYSFVQGNHIKGSAANFPTGERTISLWFYATNIGIATSGPTPIGYGGGNCGTSWFESIDNFFTPNSQQNTYQVQGHCNNESVLYPYGAIHPNNAWHQWVITTAPAGTKFYIDGAMVLSDTTFINETFVQGKDFILGGPVGVNGIGFYADGNIYGLEGKLDDVFIFNRALTPAEVLLQYNNQHVLWSTGATTTTINVTPAQTTRYYVTATNNTTTYTDSILVTISSVDTSLTVLDPLISCINNDSVRLRAGIATTYKWLRNGIPVTGATVRDFTAMQSGSYRVVVTNSLGCTDTSRQVDVFLYPHPFALFNTNNVSQCFNGNSFVFTNLSTVSSGTMAFNWNFGDGTFANTMHANHVYAAPGSYTVKLHATSNNGCKDSVSQNIIVTPTAIIAAAITSSATNICVGTPVTFTATGTNGGTAPSYQWQVNGINAGTNAATFSTAALVNGDPVRVIMTSNATCPSPAAALSNTVAMSVSAPVTTSVVITVPSTSTCVSTSVTFTAASTNGGSSPSYQWQVNGVNVGTNSSSYTTSSLINGDIVTCIMTSNAVCATVNTVNSNSITMNVINNPVITTVSIASTPGKICYGTKVTFTATATNGGSTPSYQWKLNGSNTGTNSPVFISNTLANRDIISCVMTSNAICAVPNTAASNNITVVIDPAICPMGFYMPTAFTPNKDGLNDICKPTLFGNVISYKFSVYNRWGIKIFETSDLQKGWDGKVSGLVTDTNVFIWTCSYQFSGQSFENRKGTVLLIR